MATFLADWHRLEMADPLGLFLSDGRPPREVSPPWLRLFRLASEQSTLDIAIDHKVCKACTSSVHYSFRASGSGLRRESFQVCLNCGFVIIDRNDGSPPLEGSQWAPACVAAKKLRRAVFKAAPSLGQAIERWRGVD